MVAKKFMKQKIQKIKFELFSINKILNIMIVTLSLINNRELRMLSTNFCHGGQEIYEIENIKN